MLDPRAGTARDAYSLQRRGLILGGRGHRLTTVVLSLLSDCPTLAFYILEIIVNTAMILEVSIRFVAFGNVRTAPPISGCAALC